jgi:exopolysaccharide biosynthesis polyprenyl glycosylphosphotransferase
MVLYAVLGSSFLIASRLIKLHIVRAMHRRGLGMVRAFIVGTVPAATRLANAFRNNPALGYHFLGFVTLPDEHNTPDLHLGTTQDLEKIVQDTETEEIIVALPGRQHHEIRNIAQRCQSENIRIRVVPDLFEVTMIRASLSKIEDIPLIGLRDPVITGYQSMAKRVFDIVVACILLILSIPLFIVIPLLIRLDSRGRIIFRQKRVGENGRIFDMYKFRSMVDDAEEKLPDLVNLEHLEQPVFKIPDDPRVTRIGRFLRRTSLDELPQLFNVLKGDMSMVGPRPEELQVVRYYQLWHRKRLSIKPGITGPMQVSGRGVLNLDDRIKLELMYINQYSILEDIKYLLKTVPAVCRARGAY